MFAKSGFANILSIKEKAMSCRNGYDENAGAMYDVTGVSHGVSPQLAARLRASQMQAHAKLELAKTSADPEVLDVLSQEAWDIQEQVAMNENTCPDTLDMLLSSDDPYVRSAAIRNPQTKTGSLKGVEENTSDIYEIRSMINRYEDEGKSIRPFFKHLEDLRKPRAWELQATICWSPSLTDDDMKELLANGHTLVLENKKMSADALRSAYEEKGVEVLEHILEQPREKLDDEFVAKMYDDAVELEDVGSLRILAKFDDLPDTVQGKFVEFALDEDNAYMGLDKIFAARSDITPEQAERFRSSQSDEVRQIAWGNSSITDSETILAKYHELFDESAQFWNQSSIDEPIKLGMLGNKNIPQYVFDGLLLEGDEKTHMMSKRIDVALKNPKLDDDNLVAILESGRTNLEEKVCNHPNANAKVINKAARIYLKRCSVANKAQLGSRSYTRVEEGEYQGRWPETNVAMRKTGDSRLIERGLAIKDPLNVRYSLAGNSNLSEKDNWNLVRDTRVAVRGEVAKKTGLSDDQEDRLLIDRSPTVRMIAIANSSISVEKIIAMAETETNSDVKLAISQRLGIS